MYYTTDTRVLSYDCDLKNRMKISAAMRYMQQIAGDNLVSLGYPATMLREQGMVFLLTKICLKIHRIPEFHEEIIIGTAPTHTKGVRFVREFAIDSADGERLISAISYWPLVHPVTKKVLRPKEFGYDINFQPVAITDYIDDIPFPKSEADVKKLYNEHIKYSDIDINNHVNNTVYADLICNAIPYELMRDGEIDTFTIGFQNEAVIDDVIAINRQEISEREFYVTGNHSRSECFKGLVTFKDNSW